MVARAHVAAVLGHALGPQEVTEAHLLTLPSGGHIPVPDLDQDQETATENATSMATNSMMMGQSCIPFNQFIYVRALPQKNKLREELLVLFPVNFDRKTKLDKGLI